MANRFTVSTTFKANDHMSGPMSKMEGGVRKLGKSTGETGGRMGTVFKGIGTGFMAVGTAVVAAGAAFTALAMKASSAADSIRDTAMALGISNKALQEYRYVAALSGMETSAMDEALKKLTVNLGKGGDGIEEALGKLGLTVAQLKAVGPDQVLEQIADGMARVSDPTERAAVVTALFGKSSVRMVNALSEGSAGLKSLREEASAVGYVMDETAIAAGATLGDAMDRLKLTAEGLANRLGSALVPMLGKAVDGMQGFLMANGSTLTAFGEKFGALFGKILDSLGKMLPPILDVLTAAVDAILPVLDALTPVFATLATTLGPIIKELVTALAPVLKDIAELIAQVVAQLLTALKPAFDALIKIVKALMPILRKIVDIIAKVLVPVFEILTPIIELLAEILVPLVEILMELLAPILDIVGEALVNLAKIIKAVVVPAIQGAKPLFMGLIEVIRFIVKVIVGAIEWLTNLGKAIGDAANYVGTKTAEIAQAVADFFVGVWDGLVGFVTGIVNWIGEQIDGVMGGIRDAINGVSEFIGLGKVLPDVSIAAPAAAPAFGAAAAGGVPLSGAVGTSSRMAIDVTFRGPPEGTAVKTSGTTAPGVTLTTGMVGAR